MSEKTTKQHHIKRYNTLTLIAISVGYFMTLLDLTVVNVALVNIKQQLGATITGLQWIVDGYALIFASFLLTAGALSGIVGSRKIFLIGLVLFTIASTLCGAAPSLFVLQIARGIQGLGAALLVPASLDLLNSTFPDEKERAKAIGVWAAVATIGAASGPLVGGFLVHAFTWRSVFLLNIPISIFCFLLTFFFVTPPAPKGGRSLDLPAQITIILALGLLTFAFIEGKNLGVTSPVILAAFGGFILFFLLFLFRERKAANPMLPLEVFQEKTFSAANAVGFFQTFTFYGQLFLMSLFFQDIRHYSVSIAGLALLPEFILAIVATFLSGRLTAKIGPKKAITLGLIIGGLSCFALAFADAKTSYLLIACMLAAFGFGVAFVIPAMTAAVIAHAPQKHSGIASGVLNVSRQIGGVLGVAILGVLVGNQQTFIPGMHLGFILAGIALFLGLLSTLVFI